MRQLTGESEREGDQDESKKNPLCSIPRLFLAKSYKKKNTGGRYSPRLRLGTKGRGEPNSHWTHGGQRVSRESLLGGVGSDGTQGLPVFVPVFEISVKSSNKFNFNEIQALPANTVESNQPE